MKRIVSRASWVSIGLLAACLAADATGPTPYPTNDKDWPGKGVVRKFGWMPVTREKYWKQREQAQNSVVFVGDSLTENWRDVAKAFPDLKIANRGIGGDVSRGVLFRFKEDVLDLHPRAIVLLVGINDLTAQGKPADVLSNIGEMLAQTRQQSADVPVVLCTVPATANPKAPVKDASRAAINAGLAKLAEEHKHVRVCDLAKAVANADGSPNFECFGADKLHLAAPGYAKWSEAIKPIFTELKLANSADAK